MCVFKHKFLFAGILIFWVLGAVYWYPALLEISRSPYPYGNYPLNGILMMLLYMFMFIIAPFICSFVILVFRPFVAVPYLAIAYGILFYLRHKKSSMFVSRVSDDDAESQDSHDY